MLNIPVKCDYMIHYTSELDTVLLFYDLLTKVNAFRLPSEAFETKSILNHTKAIRLWCKVIANDCCACVVSAASTLCTMVVYHFQSYLEQSLTAHIWTYNLYGKTQGLSIVWNERSQQIRNCPIHVIRVHETTHLAVTTTGRGNWRSRRKNERSR